MNIKTFHLPLLILFRLKDVILMNAQPSIEVSMKVMVGWLSNHLLSPT